MLDARRLGQATLTTPDLDRQVAYCTEVVGLTLLDRGAKHAVLASKQGLEAIALELGAPNALARIAFQVAPGSDLAKLARVLSKHGMKSERRRNISPGIDEAIVWGPGRHIIGHNIAIYHRNPDKFRVEFFCEMDLMKDEALGYFDPRPCVRIGRNAPRSGGRTRCGIIGVSGRSASSGAVRPSSERSRRQKRPRSPDAGSPSRPRPRHVLAFIFHARSEPPA
jgi:Glyoxalase/Bleomycin resistance protein/Dioxygenase superfamily